MMYTRDEVRSATLAFFKNDALATDVFVDKYALRDQNENFYELTPVDSFVRLAKEFARIESKYPNPLSVEQIYQYLAKINQEILPCGHRPTLEELMNATVDYGEIVPQGSPQAGIGNPHQLQSLSNCFVIEPPQDSYGGILYTDQQQTQIMKRRGGVGFDISTIRPKGMSTTNAAKTTDGIGVFMERFSNSCREVAQGGRRGALLQSIHVAHPQIETFINIKRDKLKVTGANISVRVTDEFMNAVENDLPFTLQWPVDVPLSEAKITKVVRARDIWEQFVDAAWYSAEPGILFWDKVIRSTPSDCYASKGFKTVSCNPCGELTLSIGDSCRLEVLDIRSFIKDAWSKNSSFDYERFDKSVQIAQRLLDDLVDLELEVVTKIIEKIQRDPESDEVKSTELNLWKKIYTAGENGRRTGLGITGLADALAMLDLKYGTQESINVVEQIYQALALGSYRSSVKMAEERGAFPAYEYDLEKDHPFLNQIFDLDQDLKARWQKFGRRNIANTTTAPVGSLSTILRCSSGIEPVFLLSYDRRRKINAGDTTAKVDFVDDLGDRWQQYTIYHHGVKQWMDATGVSDIKESPYFGATSSDVDWNMGIKLQATAQKWVCHAISRTGNIPKNASHDLISEMYINAWKCGCKGFTVYRDGSRSGVLLTGQNSSWFDGVPNDELLKMIEVSQTHPEAMSSVYLQFIKDVQRELAIRSGKEVVKKLHICGDVVPTRPKKLPCDIHRLKIITNGVPETYMALVGLLDGAPYEVFCGLAEHIELPKKPTKGYIIKNGKKAGVATYNLIIPLGSDEDDGIVFHDIVDAFANKNYGAFSRTLSLALRHRIPINVIVEQLLKDKFSDMSSFNRVIARVLKTYIPDGTAVTSGTDKKCPNCGNETLIYMEGCVKCASGCGWSKC